MQKYLPRILSLSFVLAIFGIVLNRSFGEKGNTFVLLIALATVYFAWLAVEFKVASKETRMPSTARDKGTLELYAAARALTTLLVFAYTTFESNLSLKILGVCCFVAGVGFRLWAIGTLGQMYSHRVRIQESHQLVSHGPYKFLRHPAYTGMLFAHFGLTLTCESFYPLIAWTAVFVPMVVLRILTEEKALFELPGYAAFASTRKRLVPFVW